MNSAQKHSEVEDDQLSTGSFALIDEFQSAEDGDESSDTTEIIEAEGEQDSKQVEIIQSKLNHQEASENDRFVQIGKVNYRDFFVGIFSTLNERTRRQFYFEPIILLDTGTIVTESHRFLKQESVCFTITMWNKELVSKIQEHLNKSMNIQVDQSDIHVMPYKKLQLISKSDNIPQSIKIMDQPIPYHRMNETIAFYFICDSPTTSIMLAEDFRRNPEFLLKNWQLCIESRGLSIPFDQATFRFPINIAPNGAMDNLLPRIIDLENQLKDLLNMSLKNSSNVAPVFSVKNCSNTGAGPNQSLTYSNLEFETRTDHGDFDLKTGIFTVKTAGIYQFQFSGHIQCVNSASNRLELRIGSSKVATCLNSYSEGYQQANIYAVLSLKSGQKVGVFLISGKLMDTSPNYITRFSGILFHSQ